MTETDQRSAAGTRRTGKTAPPPAAADDGLFRERTLFDIARQAWDRADWPALAALASQPLEDDPERMRLALLVAAGLAQTGSPEGARRHAKLALDWGGSPRLLAQVLISGAYNSLGRAALVLGHETEATQYFEAALAPASRADTPSDAGRNRQAEERANLSQARGPATGARRATGPAPRIAAGLEPFHSHLPDWRAGKDLPYLIETKSLPRSGLHYLKSSFEAILGDRFSFCEWYQEPGCCRQHPCVVSKFALGTAAADNHPVRMVKSHDFALTDPAYAPPPGVLRLVLVRDPLMILTSWWALDELERHSDLLATRGIRMEKIYFLHEKNILKAAHEEIEKNFRPVPPGRVDQWLQQKSEYISGFLNKWCADPHEQVSVLHYDKLPKFISKFVKDRKDVFSEKERKSAARLQSDTQHSFHPRSSAFHSGVRQITETLLDQKAAFQAACDRIRDNDRSGTL
ncbi:hypothetical protein [Pseudodonghicola flavimaris]|uniref:Sulfotransferase domain-containing protein n=1 Tax=Pseudodonghicola flavimaris TaxID=3050036 RepID=A0ABT7F983_9RHOB|nr:hypothetical protein [Pseudodonghicola flavimaris]MDK3020924.1 hypothetical protein [Pseudodonghicola flavimaris]